MKLSQKFKVFMALALPCLLWACGATEDHRRVAVESVEGRERPYRGERYKIAVGKFYNQAAYRNGLFSDGNDHLGNQAKEILKTHLSQTNRFVLLDRDNLQEIANEAALSMTPQNVLGGEIVVTGAITEFGRKVTGGQALGGILAGSKIQTAFAKVSISFVDVRSSVVLYSVQGAGEYELSDQHVLGFGGRSAYDATLNDKVLNLAILEAVDKLIVALEHGEFMLPK